MLKAKACQRCQQMKPVAEFSRNRSRADGLAHYCRPCKAEAAAKRYAARPEVVRQAARDWYGNNQDRALKRARRYRDENRDVLREKNRARRAAARAADPAAVRAAYRAWCQANLAALAEKQRRRRAANPELHRSEVRAWKVANRAASNEIKRRYKARKKAATVVSFTPGQLADKVAYWGGKCWMCGNPYEAIDHVKPIARGGPHMLANLRPACALCNHRKRDRWPFLVA